MERYAEIVTRNNTLADAVGYLLQQMQLLAFATQNFKWRSNTPSLQLKFCVHISLIFLWCRAVRTSQANQAVG